MNERLQHLCMTILEGEATSISISIDDLADRIAAISNDARDIEWVISTLEAAGCEVISPPSDAGERLQSLMPVARRLRESLGRAPTAEEVAAALRVDVESVRGALFYGQVVGRG